MKTQFGRIPVADPNGTESEVFAQGGGGDAQSTRMNTAALGGVPINPDIIQAHLSTIKGAMKGITSHLSGKGSIAKPASEADAGDMSHFDPNLGMGKPSRINK